jgi:hypothetical protein
MLTSSNYVGPQSARVSFINVERQFKLRGIPFTHVNPTSSSSLTPELAQMQSSLARSVPALCVQSKHILSGAPAAEAAMPNIRVIPLNWWSEEKAQVSFTFFWVCDLNSIILVGGDLCEAQICSTTYGKNC